MTTIAATTHMMASAALPALYQAATDSLLLHCFPSSTATASTVTYSFIVGGHGVLEYIPVVHAIAQYCSPSAGTARTTAAAAAAPSKPDTTVVVIGTQQVTAVTTVLAETVTRLADIITTTTSATEAAAAAASTTNTTSSVRDEWRKTRKLWAAIGTGAVVEYSPSVVAGYTLGTTPVHTCMALHVLNSIVPPYLPAPTPSTTALNLVALCGGSGAELLAAALHWDATAVTPLKLHLHVVDHMPAWKHWYCANMAPTRTARQSVSNTRPPQRISLDALVATLQASLKSVKLSCTFHCISLLDKAAWAAAAPQVLSRANLVTMCKGGAGCSSRCRRA